MLNLLVIRVSDIEKSKAFYECLGLRFVKEQHEQGPVHYACENNGLVFELYPASSNQPVSKGVRLAFKVDDPQEVTAAFSAIGVKAIQHTDSYMVFSDPDNIKVHVDG